ncbi:hypothetical protein LCGC14_1517290, partial [marine sediment metagenome]
MIKYVFGILCISLSFLACERIDGNEEEKDTFKLSAESTVIGTWKTSEKIPSGRSEADFRYFDVDWIYEFNSDATYSYVINSYGFDDENPDEVIGQSETSGTYEVKGDSIFIKGKTNTSWEKGFNPEPTFTLLKEVANASKFQISDDTLSLYYLSYP